MYFVFSADCLEALDIHENWMRVLNPFIAHKRLGDLYIPGSHDAAAYDCNRGGGVVFSNNAFIQTFYRTIGDDDVRKLYFILPSKLPCKS